MQLEKEPTGKYFSNAKLSFHQKTHNSTTSWTLNEAVMDTPEHDECLSAQGDSVGVDEQPRKYAEELEEEASCKKKLKSWYAHTRTHTYTLTLQVAH